MLSLLLAAVVVRRSVVFVSYVTLWTVARQAPLPLEFSRQEYWIELLFLPPGDLPESGIEPGSPESPTLAADSLPCTTWEARIVKFVKQQ